MFHARPGFRWRTSVLLKVASSSYKKLGSFVGLAAMLCLRTAPRRGYHLPIPSSPSATEAGKRKQEWKLVQLLYYMTGRTEPSEVNGYFNVNLVYWVHLRKELSTAGQTAPFHNQYGLTPCPVQDGFYRGNMTYKVHHNQESLRSFPSIYCSSHCRLQVSHSFSPVL